MQCDYMPKSITPINALEVITFIGVNNVPSLGFRSPAHPLTVFRFPISDFRFHLSVLKTFSPRTPLSSGVHRRALTWHGPAGGRSTP